MLPHSWNRISFGVLRSFCIYNHHSIYYTVLWELIYICLNLFILGLLNVGKCLFLCIPTSCRNTGMLWACNAQWDVIEDLQCSPRLKAWRCFQLQFRGKRGSDNSRIVHGLFIFPNSQPSPTNGSFEGHLPSQIRVRASWLRWPWTRWLTSAHPTVFSEHISHGTFAFIWPVSVHTSEGTEQRILGTFIYICSKGE